jgi:hypothetical protein
MRNVFLAMLSWLLALNPDPIVKWAALAASMATIAASISTVRKNHKR